MQGLSGVPRAKDTPKPGCNFIFADFRQGGISGHTIPLTWPGAEEPHYALHVEVLGLLLLFVCFGMKTL